MDYGLVYTISLLCSAQLGRVRTFEYERNQERPLGSVPYFPKFGKFFTNEPNAVAQIQMTMYISKVAACIAIVFALAGCGGGGSGTGDSPGAPIGGAGVPSKPSSVSTVVQDIVPTGAPLTLPSGEYFPTNNGDTWVYDKSQNGQTTENAVTRYVSVIDASHYELVEDAVGFTSSRTEYIRGSAGSAISAASFLGSKAPAIAQNIVGSIVEYSEPFYPVGAERKHIRQGDWGSDFDGDGINDGFHLEFAQVLVGVESLGTKLGALSTVHFSTTLSISFLPSDPNYVGSTVTAVEQTWWAPGIGLVQATREITRNGAAVVPPHTLSITRAHVNGRDIVAKSGLDGTVINIDLPHNALIYDKFRNRYLASVPGSVPTHGNSIAMINPETGGISYTPWVGSDPTALALSNDGSYLFVGLRGSGEVIKFRIADMQEIWRMRLPNDSFFGQALAASLSVSSIDDDAVAVSMMASNVSPSHRGVALIKGGVIQPKMTQVHTGSNLIAFDGSGQYVYGYNNETSEFGLRRIEVLADGLTEQQVVSTAGNYGTKNIYWTASGVWLHGSKYRASDLSPLGYVSGAAICVPLNVATKVVCSNSSLNLRSKSLIVADPSTYVVSTNVVFSNVTNYDVISQIVPGPLGQVAMHFDPVYSPTYHYPSVVLFTSEQFK